MKFISQISTVEMIVNAIMVKESAKMENVTATQAGNCMTVMVKFVFCPYLLNFKHSIHQEKEPFFKISFSDFTIFF